MLLSLRFLFGRSSGSPLCLGMRLPLRFLYVLNALRGTLCSHWFFCRSLHMVAVLSVDLGFLGLDVCSPIGSLYLLSDLIIMAYLCFWLLFLDVVVLPPRFSFESIPRGVVRVRRSVVGLMPVHDLLRDLSD